MKTSQYTEMTGTKLLDGIRRKHTRRAAGNALFTLALAAAVVFVVYYTIFRMGQWLWGAIELAVLGLLLYVALKNMTESFPAARAPETRPMFRKYGTADEIARNIAEGKIVVENPRALITDRCLLSPKDLESYMPLESVSLLYQTEHRTDGIRQSLTAHDAWGDIFHYDFPDSKAHRDDVTLAMYTLKPLLRPECLFGYTAENIKAAGQNAKKL